MRRQATAPSTSATSAKAKTPPAKASAPTTRTTDANSCDNSGPQPAAAVNDGAVVGDPANGPIHCNEVLLIGRVSAVLEPRQLPSGDVLACFRLVVQRPVAARGPGERGARVDVLDCQTARPALRRVVARLQPGDAVEVHGALRRRFFRAGGAPASRHEIEVSAMRRLNRPPRGRPDPARRATPVPSVV
ncbi:MAG TPA: single-stranded DNA-binding protein [Mycobacteriales bacterium]|nr:single-stranded DNA-binding protein [Mycobacteriales bacterium]